MSKPLKTCGALARLPLTALSGGGGLVEVIAAREWLRLPQFAPASQRMKRFWTDSHMLVFSNAVCPLDICPGNLCRNAQK